MTVECAGAANDVDVSGMWEILPTKVTPTRPKKVQRSVIDSPIRCQSTRFVAHTSG